MPRSAGTGPFFGFASARVTAIAGRFAPWAAVLVAATWFGGSLVGLYADEPSTARDSTAKSAAPSDSDAAPAKYRLAYKFNEGESVYYQVQTNMTVVTRYMDDKEEAQNKTEARKHYRVAKVHPDGSADLELYIDWVQMSAKMAANDPGVEFDSAKPETHRPKFDHILKAIGKPQAIMQFDPSGKWRHTHYAPETAVIGDLPKAQNNQVSGESQQTFLVIFPEREIAIGEAWNDRFEVLVTVDKNLKKSIKLKRTYQLEAVEDGIAKIAMSTLIVDPVNEPSISAPLIQRDISGPIEFDIEKGVIVSLHTSCDKDVIAPFGAGSAMQASHDHSERLAPAPATAKKEAPVKPGESK